MAKKTYTPENTALCNSLINAVLSSAPEGVNIKATRKDDKEVHFYIMNAPTELYDWSEYDTATRCVNIAFAIKKNENAAKLWEHLRGVAIKWREEHGGILLTAPVFIGSPRKSFTPIAKNTTLPRERAAVEGLTIPRSISPRDARIINQMHAVTLEIVAALRLYDWSDAPANYGEFREGGNVSALLFDNAPKTWNFEGLNITCAPADFPQLFDRYARLFGVRYAVQLPPLFSEEEKAEKSRRAEERRAARAEVVKSQAVATVEESPAVEVVESAPVKRVKIGRILLRLVVALLSVCVSALRLCIAALKLAERGRLVEVSREAVRRSVEAMRWSVARLWERVERRAFVAYCRPVRGCRRIVVRSVEVVRRRIFVAYCRPLRAVRRCVEAMRWSVARLWERVERCAFVAYARPVRGCRRTVVRSVEVVRWNVARTFEGLARWRGALALRVVRLANIVAFACITCARRLDNIAEGLGNM